MNYEAERKIITNFLHSKSFFGLDKFGLEGDDREECANCGYMDIISGQPFVASIAGPGQLVKYPGLLSITFFMNGDKGSGESKVKADLIIAELYDKKFDINGNRPSASSGLVINFGEGGQTPYIAEIRNEAPLIRTVVNASFVRSEINTRRP